MRSRRINRHHIILALVFAGIALGILQGLPDAMEATADVILSR